MKRSIITCPGYLVVNEQFEPVLGILEFQQAFKEHGDKGSGLLNEDTDRHQRVFALLWEKSKRRIAGQERGGVAFGTGRFVAAWERTLSAVSGRRSS